MDVLKYRLLLVDGIVWLLMIKAVLTLGVVNRALFTLFLFTVNILDKKLLHNIGLSCFHYSESNRRTQCNSFKPDTKRWLLFNSCV